VEGIKKCDKRQREESKKEKRREESEREERKREKEKMGCLLLNTSQCHPNGNPLYSGQSVAQSGNKGEKTQYHNLYSAVFHFLSPLFTLPVGFSIFFFLFGCPYCQASLMILKKNYDVLIVKQVNV
jgi:hypothetical protein